MKGIAMESDFDAMRVNQIDGIPDSISDDEGFEDRSGRDEIE